MIKEMKGWKVISCHRKSCRTYHYIGAEKGNDKWIIDYPANVEVSPKIKGSKIFVFKNRIDAEAFSDRAFSKELIVPCIAKNVVRVKWVGGSFYYLSNFWEKRSKYKWKAEAPKGTYLAESVTCLE